MLNLLKSARHSFHYFDGPESVVSEQKASPLFDRIRTHEKDAFTECISTYSGFIMQLAQAYTPNLEEAGIATAHIFNEIWHCAYDSRMTQMEEQDTISYIVHQYFLHKSFSH